MKKFQLSIFIANLISDIDASVEKHGAQKGLEAVGHGVAQLRVVAEVRPVAEQDVFLQT